MNNARASTTMKRICLTPDSIYTHTISGDTISVSVKLPFTPDIDKRTAQQLENEMHDAMEQILKRFFK